MHRALAILLTLAVLAPASSVFAAGLTLRHHSAAAQGRGLAIAAKLDDPSTTFFNPAGIVFLDGVQAQVNGTMVLPGFAWQDPDGELDDVTLVDPHIVMPAVYLTARLMDKVALGLSANVPYGLKLQYPDDWPGNAFVQQTELMIPMINPNVSFEVADGVAIAIGAFLSPSTVEIVRPTVTLNASAVGVGGTFGVQAHVDRWHMGLAYQSRFKLGFEGDADFVEGFFPDQPVTSDIIMPDVASLGVGYDVTEKLYVEVDINRTGWSSIDELAMKFPEAEIPLLNDNPDPPQNPAPLRWEDAFCYRLGLQWKDPQGWSARLGGGYDETPATDDATLTPLVPDADRTFVTAGVGIEVGSWRVDAAYLISIFGEREVSAAQHVDDFGQKYANTAEVISLSVTWAGLGDDRARQGASP